MIYRTAAGYLFDPETGRFLGEVPIDESPLDAEAGRGPDTLDEAGNVVERGELGEPVWLLPPDVTLIPPPSPEYVFDGHAWVDNGDAYAAALAAAKEAKRAELNAARDAAMAEGFSFAGARFDSDPASVQKINGAVTMALIAQSAGQPFAMQWTTADNGEVTLDATAMIGLGVACAERVDVLHHHCVSLKAEVDALDSLAAVEAFAWRDAE